MSNPIRLELSSLPRRHPQSGEDLLYDYGRAAVHRLCVDPDSLPEGAEEREVTIGHTPVGEITAMTHRVIVGWAGHLNREFCERAGISRNAIDLTEAAAIVFAALTISEFEGGRIQHVIQTTGRGDYYVEVDWQAKPALLEIRGVLADDTPTGSVTRAKVQEKRKKIVSGYVSVTAFRHRHSGMPYSALCFVSPPPSKPAKAAKRKRK
jgi:hypothetical protein